MSNKRYRENAGIKFPSRSLTILFGAFPATVFCWQAAWGVAAGLQSISGAGAFFLFFGIAGILGTYSLWSVALGSETRFVVWGLIAGLVAMTPLLLVPSSILPDIQGIDKVAATTLLEASPMVVALIWLINLFLKSGARQLHPGQSRHTAKPSPDRGARQRSYEYPD